MISTKVNMVKKITSSKKGFTLVEVIAALSIIVILFAGVYKLISQSSITEEKSNLSINTQCLIQGVRDVLYEKNNKFFKEVLNGKTLKFGITNVDSIQKMLINGIENGSYKKRDDLNYISNDSTKNNPIKYIVCIETKDIEKGLYSVVVSVEALNRGQYYYYVGDIKEENEKNFNTTKIDSKHQYTLTQEMIVRPIS